jgi:hypothetical protein
MHDPIERKAAAVLALAFMAWAASVLPAAQPAESRGTFLFAYFTGNGEDGLHFATSTDGLTWAAAKGGASFLAPQVGGRLMRDPCVVAGPDGRFHMVWTTGWWDKGFGIAHSDDLVTWSEQTFVPVMAHEPSAMNVWAPEIFYDAAAKHYLIVWSTTIPGRFAATDDTGNEGKEGGRLNHRIYATTTSDFRSYAPARLFYDDGFNVIDATIVQDGSRFVMIVKDETQRPVAKKNLRVATAGRLEGPYGQASAPFTPDWVEGPSLLWVGDEWLLYYDEYTRHRYGVLRSRDLKTWQPVAGGVRFPEGVRHGTAFSVPADVYERIARRR